MKGTVMWGSALFWKSVDQGLTLANIVYDFWASHVIIEPSFFHLENERMDSIFPKIFVYFKSVESRGKNVYKI